MTFPETYFLYYAIHINNISSIFFFFNDTATTEIYTLSLHDALPIFSFLETSAKTATNVDAAFLTMSKELIAAREKAAADRKSTRLNSSHGYISYAVFCLKKKKRHQ